MTEQIKKSIQKVSLYSDLANKMIFYLENEKSKSIAQKWKDEISDCEENLDSLLDMILEKSISQKEYNVKK